MVPRLALLPPSSFRIALLKMEKNPGMPYLDIIFKCKDRFRVPVFAYQVSGEYSMLMSAAKMNYLNLNDIVLESLISFKRAGADGFFSYFTPLILEKLQKK